MRLHRLAVTAFGPFAGTESVDFDGLATAGLYLLCGPTGAGKTSVLDAVVFALYGAVPGVRHGAARLRSDHAAADVPTEVSLELTLRGRRLRIVRRPGWERAKRRGVGTTREQPSVRVELVGADGAASVLSTRLDEAGQLLRDELGMNLEQFCQVVLLPQGRFADFLRADADSRRTILQSLFATDRFTAVETELAERRRASAREVESAQHELSRLLSRVSQASGSAHEPPAAAVGDESACSTWVQELAAGALREADRCIERAAEAERARERASTEHDLVALAAQRRAGATALAARRDALVAGATGRRSAQSSMTRARRAAVLLSPLRAVDDAAAELSRATAAERVARGELPHDVAELPRALLATLARASRDEVAVLEALRPLVGQAHEADLRAGSAARAVHQLQQELRELSRLLTEVPDALVAARSARDAARDAASRTASTAAALAGLERQVAHAGSRDALERQLGPAAAEAAVARDRTAAAHEAWLDLRERRLTAMAAELAGSLTTGAPCPVCGSCEHPAPAVTSSAVTATEEKRAHEVYERACQEQVEREAVVARLAEQTAAARGAAGPLPLAQLDLDLERARAEQAVLISTAIRCDDCDAQVARLESSLLSCSARDRVVRQELTAALAELGSAQEASTLAARRLGEACGDDATLDARVLRLTTLAAFLERASWCAEAAERCAAAHAVAQASCREACNAAGFDGPDAARTAVLSASELQSLEASALAYDAEVAVVTERLAEFEQCGDSPDDVLSLAPPHVDEARRALAEATSQLRRAAEDTALAKHRSDDLAALVSEVETRSAAMRPLHEQHGVIASLASLAEGSGDNSLRMRLSAYVLAARLEQVAEAASERLLRMSSGRYALVHTDAGSGGRGRAGLGLLVTDAWTGLSRDPATLSGGEAFCASLALALGLADVVCAEAGGAVMETLFVDEGFGSLDEDALEDVMDVLDGLREGGKVVGVVSHVGELRARIPTQLLIAKTRAGSRIERQPEASPSPAAAREAAA